MKEGGLYICNIFNEGDKSIPTETPWRALDPEAMLRSPGVNDQRTVSSSSSFANSALFNLLYIRESFFI